VTSAPPALTPQVYRIDLKYLGGPYHGWQSQPSGAGVQDHVEKALKTILRHDLRITGASRTDTGVHAEHQVGTFKTAEPYDEIRWLKSLHGLLPDSIGITSIVPVGPEFHPIFGAEGKAYRYRLWLGATRNPIIAPYCWQIHNEFDVAAFTAEAQAVVGTHDFSSFCAADSSAKSKVRKILEVDVHAKGPLVDLWIVGEGFLKQMVRIIVGSLVNVGIGRAKPGSLAEIIAAKDRKLAGKTAPGQGLTLVEIFYGPVPKVAELKARLAEDFCIKIS
jgi:tRNA pseudouridine38-40 synthase